MPVIKTFTYTKESGDKSVRTVYPIGVVDDKLFAIDLSDMDEEQREQAKDLLEFVHKQYIDGIKEAVGSSRFRYFFFEGIS